MMPRATANMSMLSAIGKLSSDEESEHDVENVKPRRGRPKGSVNGTKTAASKVRKAPLGRKRQVLEEQVNTLPEKNDDNDNDADADRSVSSVGTATLDDDLTSTVPVINIAKKKQKNGRSTSTSRMGSQATEDVTPLAKGRPGRKRKAPAEAIVEEADEEEAEQPVSPPQIPIATKTKPTRRKREPQPEIEIEPEVLTLDRALPEPDLKPGASKSTSTTTRKPVPKPTISNLPIRSPTKPIPTPQAGPSTTNDAPILRRKLGETTRKLESLDSRYTALRDVGIKEAETNFAALKKSADEQLRAATKLVDGLRAELSLQSSVAKESLALKKQVSAQTSEVQTLKKEKDKLASEVAEARTESKAMAAKLAATRSTASSVRSAQTGPGSAVKGHGHHGAAAAAGGQTVMVGSAEAAQAAAVAALKEELYSDLSGLAVLKVARAKGSDVFDCIQTGNQTSKYHVPEKLSDLPPSVRNSWLTLFSSR